MQRKKYILVTGGAGYIGSHACKSLNNAGYIPVVYDNLTYGHRDFVKWGHFEYGDLLNYIQLDKVIKKYKPEVVMHFSAFAYVGESVEDPAIYYRNNVSGTLTLLEAMKNNGINKIIFSSSCAIFGITENMPITENEEKKPINPYGRTKLMVEEILKDFYNAYGIYYIALRYFNAAGADPDLEVGEDHNPETHLIPRVLMAADGCLDELSVFGDDYNTHDGSCIRDYIHVTDLASAHVKAMEYLISSMNNDAFNIGTGSGVSVFEIIKIAKKITGKNINISIKPRREGDPAILVANSSKIQSTLDWKPGYSSTDTIIETAWKWYNIRKKIQ